MGNTHWSRDQVADDIIGRGELPVHCTTHFSCLGSGFILGSNLSG